MDELSLAKDIGIISIIGLIGGIFAKKFRFPIIIGYIFAGFLTGFLINNLIDNSNNIEGIANVGVALLLFSLGLEFSFKRLAKLKEIAFFGVFLQILLLILIFVIIGRFFNFSFYESIFFGGVASLSSTAIVVKILSEKGQLETESADITINWLLIQDLAVLPLTLLLPVFANFSGNNFYNEILYFFINIVKTCLILFLIFFLGKRILPKLISLISSLNSRELILIVGVIIAIASAYFSLSIGLSFALGAFIAGILINSSLENHAIFAEIRPIRDLFSMFFFVLLGMMINVNFVFSNIFLILLLSLFVIISKYFIILALNRMLHFHFRVSNSVSINLVQVGEFAFVMSLMALDKKNISENLYNLIISVAIVTIIITPFLMNISNKIYAFSTKLDKLLPNFLHKKFFSIDSHLPNFEKEELVFQNHVVICGFGRVGKHIGKILNENNIPYIVIETNQQVVKELKSKNIPVIYGDPVEYEVLDYAQVDKAKIIIITIPDFFSQEQIVENSLSLNKEIFIICRSHVENDKIKLFTKGAQSVIQPEFEASLSISHKVLEKYNIQKENILKSIKSERRKQEVKV